MFARPSRLDGSFPITDKMALLLCTGFIHLEHHFKLLHCTQAYLHARNTINYTFETNSHDHIPSPSNYCTHQRRFSFQDILQQYHGVAVQTAATTTTTTTTTKPKWCVRHENHIPTFDLESLRFSNPLGHQRSAEKYMIRSTTAGYFAHNIFKLTTTSSNTATALDVFTPKLTPRLVLSLPAEERSAVTGVGGRHGAHRVMHGDRQHLPTASVPESNGLLVHLPLQRQRAVEMAHKARVDGSQNVPGIDGRPDGWRIALRSVPQRNTKSGHADHSRQHKQRRMQ